MKSDGQTVVMTKSKTYQCTQMTYHRVADGGTSFFILHSSFFIS